MRRDPARHDLEVAWISHVPHVLAFAYGRALADSPAGALELAGAGFRDFTRIARSDPELWADILVANAKALAGPLQAAGERLEELARALDAGDAEQVERILAAANRALKNEFSARSGGANPEIQAAPSGHEGKPKNEHEH